jgi:2-iminoacetate synthase ThiH
MPRREIIISVIEAAGFEAVERDTVYHRVERLAAQQCLNCFLNIIAVKALMN